MIIVRFAFFQIIFMLLFNLIYKYTGLKNKIDNDKFKKILFPICFALAYIFTGFFEFH